MLCCGGRKERAPDVPGVPATSSVQLESDRPQSHDKDSANRDLQSNLPWWKREVLEERANLRQEELERETRRRHAQHVVALEQHRRVIEAQQASFVESERRQLLRTVAVELEESERARRIVGSGIVPNPAVDNGNQRTSTSPAFDQGHSSPSSAALTTDIPKRVRFQDSPVATNDASDDAAAASTSAGGLGSHARAPLVSIRETNHAFQPAASSIRTSEMQKTTVTASSAGGGSDSAAGKTTAAASPPTKPPQDAASDSEESQANLRLAAIALSGPGRLERLRGKSSVSTGNVFGSSTSSSSDRWSWTSLQSGDAAWGFYTK